MRVLVTGAAGFVGRHLIRALLDDPQVSVAATGLGGELPVGAADERLSWHAMDVTSTESLRATIGAVRPDRVYHLAGQSSVGGSFRAPVQTWEINALGTVRLLRAMGEEGLASSRALVVSSAEVYGAVAPEAQPIGEGAPLHPVSPYGASKAAAELAGLQAAAAGEVEVVVARSFNHTGPGQDERFVLPSMARQLTRLRASAAVDPVLHVGNLEVWRDFLDVRDVVRAYIDLVERGTSGEVYNVCSGVARSLAELVKLLVELSGTGARVEVDPERVRPVDVPLLVGSAERLQSLGWRPSIPLEQTLGDLLSAAA
ncbi:MAG TPA: GDP-mannose 4,6-dehydratase [Longimicrobiaceae bacterium]|nr:GDP-mannose 4,6-dehydratase [Longimicrobiaceae bacterium]